MSSGVLERQRRHLDQVRRSTAALEQARKHFAEKHKYSTSVTRQKLRDELSSRTDGLEAYEWQVNVSEALLLGLDCTVIAGTGAGKTMPFVMPLFIEPKKVVLIISPLNALEEDQASRFRDMGLSAVAVNGETYSSELHKDLDSGKYQVILSSPEMCLKHSDFRKLLSSAKFSKGICSIVVDEAHCITQWGPQFRPEYADLGDIRAFAPHAPVLITSATLTPSSLDHARKIMHVDASSSYHLMLGVDRPNIAWSVRHMERGKDLESLQFIVPPHKADSDTPIQLISTMVFFDDISLAMTAMVYLRDLLPPSYHQKIAVYNSRRTPRAKKKIMKRFRSQEIQILLTTEAAGMGCDIPHIVRVVQFSVPKSLDIWLQRGGRAGRDKSIHAEAILMVQPSVFQEVSHKKSERDKSGPTKKTGKTPEGDMTTEEQKKDPATKNVDDTATNTPQYRKEIHDGLRMWIEAIICRRDIVDEYYDSGVPRLSESNKEYLDQSTYRRQGPPGVCCDNCQRKADGVDAPLPGAVDQNDALDHIKLPVGMDERESDSDDDETQTGPDQNVNAIKRRGPSILPQRRQGAHLIDAQNSLQQLRKETWRRLYARRPWSNELILPTRVISNIANKTNILTVNDLIQIGGWSQHRAFYHGEELLSVLLAVDDRERTRRVSEKKKKEDERLERRRVAEALKEAKKIETKRRREEERLSRLKRPRPSRAKGQLVGMNVGGNVAVDIGCEKENVAPLSAPGPQSVMPPTSWTPTYPFTPPQPASHFSYIPPSVTVGTDSRSMHT
ncbi:hypothetical protein AX14_009490 [Amanita brunnescens Koide BX004]|nr:hypothetical protein AX14_009490 [Amanita brunnescens Koide BX004]